MGQRRNTWSPMTKWGKKRQLRPSLHVNSHHTLVLEENGSPPRYSSTHHWKDSLERKFLPVGSVMSSKNDLVWERKMYWAADIQGLWGRWEWLGCFVRVLEEAKLEDCPGKASSYWLSHLSFLSHLSVLSLPFPWDCRDINKGSMTWTFASALRGTRLLKSSVKYLWQFRLPERIIHAMPKQWYISSDGSKYS